MDKRKRRLERVALAMSVLILAAAAWFWVLQIDEVLEVLELAYG